MALKFTVGDQAQKLHTHRIWDICEFLAVRVVEPFLIERGVRLDPRFTNYFNPAGGSSPYEPTGVIEFFPPGLYADQIDTFEQAIHAELAKLGIQLGPVERELYPGLPVVRVVRIPIVANPTALSGPPEVSMSISAGRTVLRDLLGFQPAQGRYEFTAAELLTRVLKVTEEGVRGCSAAPVKDPKAPKSVRRLSSALTVQRIRRCLAELEQYARWVLDQKYRTIQVLTVPTR